MNVLFSDAPKTPELEEQQTPAAVPTFPLFRYGKKIHVEVVDPAVPPKPDIEHPDFTQKEIHIARKAGDLAVEVPEFDLEDLHSVLPAEQPPHPDPFAVPAVHED